MKIKIRLGPDPLQATPAALADLFTTPDSDHPERAFIQLRDSAGKTLSQPHRHGGPRMTPQAAADLYYQTITRYLESTPAEAASWGDWWDSAGRYYADRLKASWNAANTEQQPTGAPPDNTTPKGAPGYRPDNTGPGHPKKLTPAKHPPYTIEQSAEQAALWLAAHWPNDVADMGQAAFLAARKAEILAGDWNSRYWQELDRQPPTAAVSQAICTLDPDWATPPFNDPDRKKTLVAYRPTGTPYPLPPPGTGGSMPDPGYQGALDGDELKDEWHACYIDTYEFPEPYDLGEFRPVFLDTHSHHLVTADAPPSKVQYGTYALPIFAPNADPAGDETIALPQFARRYNWTKRVPPGGSGPYNGHMERHWILDCRVMALTTTDQDGKANRLRIKLGPLAAMGRYFGKAAELRTSFYLSDPHAYLAKTPDGGPHGIEYALRACPIRWFYYPVWAPDPNPGAYIQLGQDPWQQPYGTPGMEIPLGTLPGRHCITGEILPVPPGFYYGNPGPVAMRKPELVPAGADAAVALAHQRNLDQFGNDDLQPVLLTLYKDTAGNWHSFPGWPTAAEAANLGTRLP